MGRIITLTCSSVSFNSDDGECVAELKDFIQLAPFFGRDVTMKIIKENVEMRVDIRFYQLPNVCDSETGALTFWVQGPPHMSVV